jgi:hypothetical protein
MQAQIASAMVACWLAQFCAQRREEVCVGEGGGDVGFYFG